MHTIRYIQAAKLIARELDLWEATVKVYLKAILRKGEAENRTQAAMWEQDTVCELSIGGAVAKDLGRRSRPAQPLFKDSPAGSHTLAKR